MIMSYWYALGVILLLVGYLVAVVKDELYDIFLKEKTRYELLDTIHHVDHEIRRGSLCIVFNGKYLKNKQALSFLYRRLYDIEADIERMWEYLYNKLVSMLFGRAFMFLWRIIQCSRRVLKGKDDGGYLGDTDDDDEARAILPKKKRVRFKKKKNYFAGTGKRRRQRQHYNCSKSQPKAARSQGQPSLQSQAKAQVRMQVLKSIPTMCLDRSVILRTVPITTKKKRLSMRTLIAKEKYLLAKDKQMVCKRCQSNRPCNKSHVKQIERYLKLCKQ